jgi:hypothetical protein
VRGGEYILKYGSILATVLFLIYEDMKETLRMKRHTFPVLTEGGQKHNFNNILTLLPQR